MVLINNEAKAEQLFTDKQFENGLSIYEVIRVFKGHPIFLKDNLLRLSNSLKKSNIDIQVESLNIPDKLRRLIDLNHMSEGNFKYILHFCDQKTDEYIFQIPHAYPTEDDYKKGVKTITYQAMRENPGVKYINNDLRTATNRLIEEYQVREVLLVDDEGFITEGSRSNVFFVKGSTLYTSPVEYVLPGTSRKRVFNICKEHGIQIIEKRIDCKSLSDYDIAFITGTSPLILPINQIDEVKYTVNNPFLHNLMKIYFSLLD